VDEAVAVELRRHAQRDGRTLAQPDQTKGEVRSQWYHVIDVAPTVLAAAGLPEPKTVNGVVHRLSKAVSMLPSFTDAKAEPAQNPSLTLHAGMKGMSENVFIDMKNRSFTITGDIDGPAGGANGVILDQGGRFGGWSLYMKGGKPIYVYNFLGLQRFTVAAAQAVPAGKATIRLEFAYDGGGLAKGGLATIYVNDKKAAEGRIEHTQPMIFSADETADVGEDDATPVTEDYRAYDNEFTGKILRVTVDVKAMGAGDRTEAARAGAETAQKVESAK